MGSNVTRSASVARIKDSGEKTMAAATARGGEVLDLAQKHVASILGLLVTCEQQLKQACTDDDLQHATLLARDNESDLEIGAVCNEIWNAMGRPKQSIDYDLIVNGGKSVWTDGDPAKQPALMSLLAQNIRGSQHPKVADKKEDWAKRIEAKAAAQAEAAKPSEASYARVTFLTMQRRTLADALQVALVRLKRDMKNLGMTEAQVHEIIPDVPPSTRVQPTPPKPAPTAQA
jgi:hypothetical protein